MVTPIAAGLLLGAMVGLRYRVWLLLLIIAASVAIAVIGSVSGMTTSASPVLSVVLFAVALQAGFLGGSVVGPHLSLPRKLERMSEVSPR